jgi:hypothetical protein
LPEWHCTRPGFDLTVAVRQDLSLYRWRNFRNQDVFAAPLTDAGRGAWERFPKKGPFNAHIECGKRGKNVSQVSNDFNVKHSERFTLKRHDSFRRFRRRKPEKTGGIVGKKLFPGSS